ncbi:LOG family protein, partial [Patescibacteria group bacterium]|nr:LOG family protein [Patescibacteria group bacterium]
FLGGAGWQPDSEVYEQAYETARLLAQNGYEIVNGGGPGVMKAATLGAKMGGGKTLIVTYHPNKPKRHYEGIDPTNMADQEIKTLDYFDRTKVILQNTDVHIVFNGSLGTLSEFGMTWISSWIHEPNHKPIIMFGSFWRDILDTMQKYLLISDQERNMLKVCSSPQEVLDYITSLD